MPSSAPERAPAARRRKRQPPGSLDRTIARLRAGKADNLALFEVIDLAEHVMGSLQEVFSALDATILREFDAIATSIARAKDDIGRLRPGELSAKRIPQAGRELAAIIEATEDATHRIMAAAERILAIEADDVASYRGRIEAEITAIFEACSFQDITGQRVTKVVETLEDIDERVGHIAGTLGIAGTTARPGRRERARRARKKALILNGPALEGEGVGQDEIDALFGQGTWTFAP